MSSFDRTYWVGYYIFSSNIARQYSIITNQYWVLIRALRSDTMKKILGERVTIVITITLTSGLGPLTNRKTERPTTHERCTDLSEREANSLILEHGGIAER